MSNSKYPAAWKTRRDLTGLRFGRLVITGYAGNNQYGMARWHAVCDCGNKAIRSSCNLQWGKNQSCGCARRKWPNRGFGFLVTTYRRNADRDGRPFSLSNQECDALFKGNCFYCGAEPSAIALNVHIKPSDNPYRYNGIDRIDSNLGYTADNTRSCCSACNFAKRMMSEEEFSQWVARVYRHFVVGHQST